jgi:GH25 family lysozyme M1 (1,4-beta-N-acetylmuramidase)
VNRDGRAFGFCKATEGVGFEANTFRRNWIAIKNAGMRRGCYHFARPDLSGAVEEADYFLSVLGPVEADDILALDLEAGNGDLAQWALAWLERVESVTGVRPILYSGLWFMEPRGLLAPELAVYPLWLAAYQDNVPDAPAPWTDLAIWQKNGGGIVDGVVGLVDEDVVYPLAISSPAPAPQTPISDEIRALVGKTQDAVVALLESPDDIKNMEGDGLDHWLYYTVIPGTTIEIILDSGIVRAVVLP